MRIFAASMAKRLGIAMLACLLLVSLPSFSSPDLKGFESIGDGISKSIDLNALCAFFRADNGRWPENSKELLSWMDSRGKRSSLSREELESAEFEPQADGRTKVRVKLKSGGAIELFLSSVEIAAPVE